MGLLCWAFLPGAASALRLSCPAPEETFRDVLYILRLNRDLLMLDVETKRREH